MEIKQITGSYITDRQFIRFTVFQVPNVSDCGEVKPYRGQWYFNATIKAGDKIFNVDWYQPESDAEPNPDARYFIPPMMALLSRVEKEMVHHEERASK